MLVAVNWQLTGTSRVHTLGAGCPPGASQVVLGKNPPPPTKMKHVGWDLGTFPCAHGGSYGGINFPDIKGS